MAPTSQHIALNPQASDHLAPQMSSRAVEFYEDRSTNAMFDYSEENHSDTKDEKINNELVQINNDFEQRLSDASTSNGAATGSKQPTNAEENHSYPIEDELVQIFNASASHSHSAKRQEEAIPALVSPDTISTCTNDQSESSISPPVPIQEHNDGIFGTEAICPIPMLVSSSSYGMESTWQLAFDLANLFLNLPLKEKQARQAQLKRKREESRIELFHRPGSNKWKRAMVEFNRAQRKSKKLQKEQTEYAKKMLKRKLKKKLKEESEKWQQEQKEYAEKLKQAEWKKRQVECEKEFLAKKARKEEAAFEKAIVAQEKKELAAAEKSALRAEEALRKVEEAEDRRLSKSLFKLCPRTMNKLTASDLVTLEPDEAKAKAIQLCIDLGFSEERIKKLISDGEKKHSIYPKK